MSPRVEWVPIGEFRVSRDPQVQLVTVTGPCVALAVFIHAACGIANLLGFAVPGEPVARPLSPEVLARVRLSQGLAGALPGILGELRSWGLLDMVKPDDDPAPGAGEA